MAFTPYWVKSKFYQSLVPDSNPIPAYGPAAAEIVRVTDADHFYAGISPNAMPEDSIVIGRHTLEDITYGPDHPNAVFTSIWASYSRNIFKPEDIPAILPVIREPLTGVTYKVKLGYTLRNGYATEISSIRVNKILDSDPTTSVTVFQMIGHRYDPDPDYIDDAGYDELTFRISTVGGFTDGGEIARIAMPIGFGTFTKYFLMSIQTAEHNGTNQFCIEMGLVESSASPFNNSAPITDPEIYPDGLPTLQTIDGIRSKGAAKIIEASVEGAANLIANSVSKRFVTR